MGTLPCRWGHDYGGDNIQGAIRDAIRNARFVVADLTSRDEKGVGAAQANINASIEAGIAWGAEVRVLCLAEENPRTAEDPEDHKTRHVPFIFRNSQVKLYGASDRNLAPGVEFLGRVHNVVLRDRLVYGRRVINRELNL